MKKYAKINKVALATEVDSLVYEQTKKDSLFNVPPVKYQGYFFENSEENEEKRVTSESLEALIVYITEKGYPIVKFNKN